MKEQPEIHMPRPSFWPISLAFGMVLICFGIVSEELVTIVGLIVLLVAIAGWTLENRAANQGEHHE